MPPIILGGPGQLNEWNGKFDCGRMVTAKCAAGIRNEGRVVISKETNQIVTIEETNGQGFKSSFADLLAVTCALNLPHLNEAIAEINRIVLEEFRRICAASISIIHLSPKSELPNNVNIRITGTGKLISFIVRDGSFHQRNIKEKFDSKSEGHQIGAQASRLLEWEEAYGPVYQFFLASRTMMGAATNGIIANIAKDPNNGVQKIWEDSEKLNNTGDSRSLVHIGEIPRPV